LNNFKHFISMLMNLEQYDHLPKGDIFSLGASMYEIALGRELPANGPEWNQIRDGGMDDSVFGIFLAPLAQLTRLMMHPEPIR